MATKRREFCDQQKAEIFVLDKAMCCMSGKSLWLMDYGAAPSFRDWVDHIKPAALGGGAEIENGACMSWYHNHLKRDSQSLASSFLFFRGAPTQNFYFLNERIPDDIATHIKRFGKLHWSDWFFNRAVSHVLIAASSTRLTRKNGESFSRGPDYWAGAAIKALIKWRDGSSEVSTMSRRGLLPGPFSEDRRALLSLKEASNFREVLVVIKALVPFVRESDLATQWMSGIEDQVQAKELLHLIRSNQYVVPRVKRAIRHNLLLLDLPES
jgi:hypothetical protein